MSNPIQIYFIYANDCPECNQAKLEVDKAIQDSGVVCCLRLFDSEKRVAVNIAIENDIDDIPACVVGNKENVFQAKDITRGNILSAILSLSSN